MEIEIKAIAPPNIHSSLETIGAVFDRKTREKNIVFNHKGTNFFKRKELIRVREEKDKVTLTYKKRLLFENGLRKATEINIIVSPNIISFLEGVGFYQAVVYHKTREYWNAKGIEVSVDSVDELGEFVELESKGATDQELRGLASKLGITNEMVVNSTYPELIMEKLKNK